MRLLRALLVTLSAILATLVLLPLCFYLANLMFRHSGIGLVAMLALCILAGVGRWRAQRFAMRNPWTLPGAGRFGTAYQDRPLREQTERELAAERHPERMGR